MSCRAIVRSPQRIAFSAIIVAESIALGGIAAIFRAYGRDIAHVSLTHEGLLLAPAAVLGGLSVIAGGAIADRIGARRVMAPGFALAGAAVLLLSHFARAVVHRRRRGGRWRRLRHRRPDDRVDDAARSPAALVRAAASSAGSCRWTASAIRSDRRWPLFC